MSRLQLNRFELRCIDMRDTYCVRPMTVLDHSRVSEIDITSFSEGWSVERFGKELSRRSCEGYVVEREEIFGYCVLQHDSHKTRIISMAVEPCFRRLGLGRMLLESAKTVAKRKYMPCLQALVSERNLPAQLFFSRNGFRCTEIIRDKAVPRVEDFYRMRLSLGGE